RLPLSRFLPKISGLACSGRSVGSAFTSRPVAYSKAPSLNTLQFWYTSTNEVPTCSAARLRIIERCLMLTSIERATKVSSQPIATDKGCKGLSITPLGVLLVTCPSTEVGEYWPLVSP